MANTRDNIALEWTRAELIETLASARRSLEGYADGRAESGAPAADLGLAACIGALHQVHGVLFMLELASAATFAAQLEEVASALAAGSLADPVGASETLMQGLLELPEYLDAQRSGLGDTIVPLLPVLNELRRHLHQPPLGSPKHEHAITAVPGQPVLEHFVAIDGLDKVRRVRGVFQQVLLSVLKGGAALTAIETLQKVSLSMQRLCEGTPKAVLWQAFDEYLGALLESLGRQPGPLGTDAVKLLRRMDSELRMLAQDGAEELARPVSIELAQRLISAARARGRSNAFLDELEQSLASSDVSEALASTGRNALASAAAALRDDLAGVRDQVDFMLRGALGDGAESARHEALLAPLKQISSTMSLLGLESSRAIIAEQIDTLTGPVVDAAMLESMAGALDQVDSNLASLSQGGKGDAELILDAAQQAVIAEARHGLELLKQSVVDYVSSQWDTRHLQSLPEALAPIANALRMVPLPDAAALVDRCEHYISGELLAGHVPDWAELDRLAGAISGIDYYLERLAGPSTAGAEDILDVAKRSLATLRLEPELPSRTEVPAQPPVEREAVASETILVREVAIEAAVAEPAVTEHAVTEHAVTEHAEEERIDFEWIPPGPDSAHTVDETVDATVVHAVEDAVDHAVEDTVDHAVEPAEPEIESVLMVGTDSIAATPEAWPTETVAETEAAETLVPAPAPASALESGAGVAETMATALSSEAATVRARLASIEDEFEVDDEILEVFLEEVDDVLAAIDAGLPPWQRDIREGQHGVELRRAFHTLKGSGRLVGAKVLGELAWSVEQMLNRVIDGTIEASPALHAVIEDARVVVPELRAAFADRIQPSLDGAAAIIVRAERIAAGIAVDAAETGPEPSALEPLVAPEPAARLTGTLAVFRDEAREHLEVIAAAREASGYRIDEAVARALHTLSGSAAMVGVPVIAELARAALDLVQALLGSREFTAIEGAPAQLLADAAGAIEADLGMLDADAPLEPHAELIAAADRLRLASPTAPLIQAVLGLPGLDALLGAQQMLEDWQRLGFDVERNCRLENVLEQVGNLAAAPEHAPLAELASALLDAHARLSGARLDDRIAAALLAGHERLLGQIDALVAGQPLRRASEAVAELVELQPPPPAEPQALAEPEAPAEPEALEPPVAEPDSSTAAAVAGADAVPQPQYAASTAPASTETALEAVDPELIGIFLEEADELLDQIDQAVQSCVPDADPQAAIEALLRALHTLKGGARLAGLAAAGDAAHEFESWLVSLRDSGAAFDPLAVSRLHDQYYGLAAIIATATSGVPIPATAEPMPVAPAPSDEPLSGAAPEPLARPLAPAAEPLSTEPEQTVDQSSSIETIPWTAPEAFPAVAAPGSVEPVAEAPSGGLWEGEVPTPHLPAAEIPAAELPVRPAVVPFVPGATAPAPTDRRGAERNAEEVVRVRAALLDQLVNLAGEGSIIRGRVQQGLSEFGGALDEMEMTIQRLREQLRRLEIETEAQILFRRERPDAPAYEDFDPLELDRYSQLQQLSRSLSESASDMLDLKETLRLRAGETEALLIQQGRINTQLQEGLMRSRMVPFARLLPRLRRTVRQVAQDLGKSVELVAYNVEGELDRSLLDRMIAPLEHMLRNAVDHGIEPPDDRRAAGKSETGQVEIRLSREAGDVVIEIRDDGAGIDVERVRTKALDQGLMAADAELSDDEIRQFIFAPGFSTARSVTQISGRGVGMDVAYSAVKQLGGSIGLSSESGRGTCFLVRVPFTVSVNRALMVSVGEDLYAVPLNTIEGIVLARGDELAGISEMGNGRFNYAGGVYQVRHLGEYLGRPVRAGGASGSVPVVLVRSGDSAVAVQVDGVQGSREIVVKGLGPQFAGVAGISGATILGDGGVVVILDLPALVRGRRDGAVVERKRSSSAPQALSVLVVDDSVTVRKVTSRLLERQGMEVMLAKDGVEAVAALQERRPDVMLLDIEMPRMDGFEVLRHVRHDPRLVDLPVIMISSRTGAKHKDRAAELGVSFFLGKPFQEAELLNVIDKFLE